MSRRMQRAVVDLPQPDSPTRPIVFPAPMSKETPATAETSPRSPPSQPPPTSKVLTRSRTEMAASSGAPLVLAPPAPGSALEPSTGLEGSIGAMVLSRPDQ